MLTMTAQEQLKFDIVVKISTGKMASKEGRKILNVSERTLRRLLQSYSKKGPLFIKHGNYKKSPINLTNPELKNQVIALVREKYFDFNLTHCLEKLKSEHQLEPTFRSRPTSFLWARRGHYAPRRYAVSGTESSFKICD
jgi:transposase